MNADDEQLLRGRVYSGLAAGGGGGRWLSVHRVGPVAEVERPH